jgi:hypothetical protein
MADSTAFHYAGRYFEFRLITPLPLSIYLPPHYTPSLITLLLTFRHLMTTHALRKYYDFSDAEMKLLTRHARYATPIHFAATTKYATPTSARHC